MTTEHRGSLPLTQIPETGFTSFVDAPVCRDLNRLDADVAVLGVPYGIPYEMGQCRSFGAPAYIREKSLRYRRVHQRCHALDKDGAEFRFADFRLVDCGDVPGDPLDFRGAVDRATAAVGTILAKDAVPVVIGGDDAIPIPVVRAYRDFGPIVVLQIDEHLDFSDGTNGVTEGYSSPMRRISEMPWVTQIVQVGLHGFGPAGQMAAATAAGNLLITEREVHESGIAAILDKLPAADYFITLDFDGLDPAVCPAVSHPEPGGLTYAETVDLLGGLTTKGRIVGMDFAEFVPDHDIHGWGGHAAARLILDILHAMQQAGQFRR
jgi:agmatinase